MTLQSMTGFARVQGRVQLTTATSGWAWELRSVNGKGLDIRLRLPPGCEQMEAPVRKALSDAFRRGSVTATLSLDETQSAQAPVLNHVALEGVLTAAAAIAQRTGGKMPSVDTVLGIRGVLEFADTAPDDEVIQARDVTLLAGLSQAVTALGAAREAEGREIVGIISAQVREIERLSQAIDADPSRSTAMIAERLRKQVETVMQAMPTLDPQRLHQEAALIAVKADIREELDRLAAHCRSAAELLVSEGPVGRKFDFLAQEFNRECNTICSKSNASTVTHLALEMKVAIDQLREQVQNLE